MPVSRTISCRIPQDLYESLQDLATEKRITMTEAIVAGLRKVCEGKIALMPPNWEKRVPFCPQCNFILYPEYSGKVAHLACFRCGFYTSLPEPEWEEGEYYLPEK